MGIFNFFKQRTKNEELCEEKSYISNIQYKNINIEIPSNVEESKHRINKDYSVLEWKGIENLIKEKFIPWLKGSEFIDMDNNKIYKGLKIYAIEYSYYGNDIDSEINVNGSLGKGEFHFHFESADDYTVDMLEAAEMVVEVRNGKIVNVSCFDV